jgi:precorrin-6B methylase 1
MKKENIEILSKKIDRIEKLMWEDRKFFITMMAKIDRLVKFVKEISIDEDTLFFNEKLTADEETFLTNIMEKMEDFDNIKEEFLKYHKMVNTDQVGES